MNTQANRNSSAQSSVSGSSSLSTSPNLATDYIVHVEHRTDDSFVGDFQCSDLRGIQDRILKLTDNQARFDQTGDHTYNISSRGDGEWVGWIAAVPVPKDMSIQSRHRRAA